MSGDGDNDLPAAFAPRRPSNRAGLAAIDYRVGRHGDFLSRMLHKLPRERVVDPATLEPGRPLAGLTSRAADDPTIALADAFSVTLDVLSFYQERIANEGYLRTALERDSMVELAREIGYELRPGVAASASLAFTVEDRDDPYRVVTVPTGTQVLSVPQQPDERPQTFETVAPITARAEWNDIALRTERPQHLAMFWDEGKPHHGELCLLDLDSSFDFSAVDAAERIQITGANLDKYLAVVPGLDIAAALDDLIEDAKLNPEIEPIIRGVFVDRIQLRGLGLSLRRGMRMLAVGVGKLVQTQAFRVVETSEDIGHQLTEVVLAPLVNQPPPLKPLKLKFITALLPQAKLDIQPIAFNVNTATRAIKRATWSGNTLSSFIKLQAWPRVKLMLLFRFPREIEAPPLEQVSPGLVVLRQSTGFFGNAAPKWKLLPKSRDEDGKEGPPEAYPKDWEPNNKPVQIWTDSQGNTLTGKEGQDPREPVDVFLEREFPEIVPGDWVLFENPNASQVRALRVAAVGTQSRADFALSGKATGLLLATGNDEFTQKDKNALDLNFRTAIARVASQLLPLGGLPIVEPIAAGTKSLTLDGLYLDVIVGSAISIVGERADAPGLSDGETLVIAEVTHVGGFTTLGFAEGLSRSYVRTSLKANANVAPATHGEFGEEVLGSGDALLAHQAFKLSRPQLTFVPAATDSGTATTLVVRVDGVAWSEVEALYDAGPNDQVYAVRIDDDGVTRVVFGDGLHGKRLPTGNLNVTAGYRSGMGVAGQVAEQSLTLLKSRPLGIRAVINRSPARGAAPAETLADARISAPQSVRVLGRIVSLIDYEDFARGFAGIGKAKVAALRLGRRQVVHLSVAPRLEGVFDPADDTLRSLGEAIERRRDPGQRLFVAPHRQRYFQIAAKLAYDRCYRAEDVRAAVEAELLRRFGYDARALATPISAAEITAAIQGAPGVVYSDLDQLSPYGTSEAGPATLTSVMPAGVARVVDAEALAIDPAELLIAIPTGIALTLEVADA
ncbi:MAG: putative baseplate assembly protein [Rhizobiales bacterium]|nr:putative baseplate assembly protein [Hyphomicrobiales bacterium]